MYTYTRQFNDYDCSLTRLTYVNDYNVLKYPPKVHNIDDTHVKKKFEKNMYSSDIDFFMHPLVLNFIAMILFCATEKCEWQMDFQFQ